MPFYTKHSKGIRIITIKNSKKGQIKIEKFIYRMLDNIIKIDITLENRKEVKKCRDKRRIIQNNTSDYDFI